MSKRGRKTRLTRKLIEEIEKLARSPISEVRIADKLCIPRSLFRNWMSRGEQENGTIYAEFLDRYKKARAELCELLLYGIYSGDPGWQAKAWIAERLFPEFQIRKAMEFTGTMKTIKIRKYYKTDSEKKEKKTNKEVENNEQYNCA